MILVCGLANLAYSQQYSRAKANVRAKINQVKSYEGGTGGACWESGTEEYSAMVHLRVYNNDVFRHYRSACVTCNNNGNCTYGQGTPINYYLGYLPDPYNNYELTDGNIEVDEGVIGTSIDAWENDDSPRCEPNGGDDCRTNRYNYQGIPYKSLVFPSNEVYTTSETFGSTNNHTWSVDYTWKYTTNDGFASIPPLQIFCNAQTEIIYANNIEAYVVELVAGETYEFETTAGPDTYLRLYGSNGYSIVASDDDGGTGVLSKLVYSPSTTGTYFIEVSQYPRNVLSQNATLSYLVQPPPPPTLTASETLVCRGTPVTFNLTSYATNIDEDHIDYRYGSNQFFSTLTTDNTYVWNSASLPNENQFEFKGVTDGIYNYYYYPSSYPCSGTSPTIQVIVVDAYPTIGYGGSPVICPGDNFQMFANFDDYNQGCSYQWQISSAGASGPWSNIPGATNSQFNTGTLAATRWYRVKPICPGNGCTNSVSPVQQVRVRTSSEIVCPSSQVQYTTGQCGQVANYTAPYIPDYCSTIPITQVGGLPSGSFFPIGTTTNTFLATSTSGNTATCSFNIVVNDNSPLVIQCGSGTIQTSIYSEPGTCVVTEQKLKDYNWGYANDNCPFTLTVAPAGPYGVGAHFLTWTATSSEGTKTCTGTITIEDNVAPIAQCKNAIVQLDASGNGSITGADVDNGSSDACGIGSLVLSKTNFTCANIGNNPVTLTVYDVNNKFATCNATVTVLDDKPVAVCQNVAVQLNGSGNGSTTAAAVNDGSSDACGSITAMALSQSNFTCTNVGANTVTLTVTDNNNNTGTCTATVTVVDNEPPTATCQDITVSLDGTGNVVVSGISVNNNSSDACGGIASMSLNPTSFNCSNIGANGVTLTVTDNSNNAATCSATVTVEDNTLPVATCQDITVTDNHTNSSTCTATVTVVDDTPPVATCQDITVTLNAAGNGSATATAVDNSSADACGIASRSLDNTDFSCESIGSGNTVTLTVTDNNSNSSTCTATVTVQDNIAPEITCPPTANISADAGQCTSSAAIGTATATDNCSASVSGPVPAGPYGLGTTAVSWTATDASGNSAPCVQNVVVTDAENPTVTCPANRTAEPNLFNPCSAIVGGIDAVFNDNCSGTTVDYALSGATTGSGNGQASGQTFQLGTTTVLYTVTDGANLSSDCVFTVTVTDCNTVFSGTILWETDGTSGVQNATVNLTGDATGNDLTDSNGEYLISLPYQFGNFVLKPVKTINKLNGVTSADATAIQLHVTYTNPLPAPFKRIAADVNTSNSISTLDATLINQALLGNPAAMNQIKSWRFVPEDHIFPNPDVPWGFPEQINLTGVGGNQSGKDFIGIKLGDVVSTWANPANFGAGEPLVLRVQDQRLQEGRAISVDLRADQLDDLSSFQFALHFDPTQLRLVSIDPEISGGLPMTTANFGTYNLAEGEIRAVWTPEKAAPLEEATMLFRLRFEALLSGALLSEVLQLNDDALAGRVYNSQLEESGVALKYAATTSTNNPASANGLRLLQNQPNPFTEETTIGFVLPAGGGCDAQLRIFDVTGRELWRSNKYYPAGYHAETVHLGPLTASGVLYYELTTPYGTLTKRMLQVGK